MYLLQNLAPLCVGCTQQYGLAAWTQVYSLSVNDDNIAVLRTSNKKYYKKFDIPDLKRIGVPIVGEVFTMAHANNTLIISYDKPQQYMEYEQVSVSTIQGIFIRVLPGDWGGCRVGSTCDNRYQPCAHVLPRAMVEMSDKKLKSNRTVEPAVATVVVL